MTLSQSIDGGTTRPEPGILTPALPLARSITFRLQQGGHAAAALRRLCAQFSAFVESLDRMMVRMVGIDDGIVDGLFAFSRAVTGGYCWCPAVVDGRLDLPALGIP